MTIWQDIKGWLSLKAEQAKATYRLGYDQGLRMADERMRRKEKRKEDKE